MPTSVLLVSDVLVSLGLEAVVLLVLLCVALLVSVVL